MKRREFLRTAAIASLTALAHPAIRLSWAEDSLEIEEATVLDLQKAMTTGSITSQQLTEMYMKRIGEIDKVGPAINAIIELNPDAMQIAETMDRERKEKGARSSLHGIPVLIKDNIDTADRMMTTAGSLALLGSTPAQDSFVAKKLRDAGAVILGKTNLSEWANFRSRHSISGWSGRGGQTKDPYVLDRNPCGSSSGTGAAVAANLCAVGIGTETDGSVVCPSSACGLVGIKPTLGLISRAGIIPIAHSQDTAGPMARTVTDAVILLGALTGMDPRDPATKGSRGKALADYTKFLDPFGLQGTRVGVVRKSFGFNEQVDRQLNDLIKEMKNSGAEIVDPANIPTAGKFDDSEMEVLLYEFKADLNAYLASLGPNAPVHSIKEIIDFNEKNAAKEMPYFGQDIMIQAESKGPLTSKEYLEALKKNHTLTREQGIDQVLKTHHLDAMIAPTGGPAWLTDIVNGDCFGGGYSSASAVAGYPHITVPAGFVSGLPFGLSFFASAYSEPTLIKLAYAFEQMTKIRQKPQFLPSVKVSTNTVIGPRPLLA
jgi:amidase